MKKVELFNDHFQNFKVTASLMLNLLLPTLLTTSERTHTLRILHGTRTGTTRTERANWLARSFSIPTKIFALRSLCTFAVRC